MPDNIDAAERMVDEWTRRVQDQARRYQAMADRVQDVSVTERSTDHAIEVTVNAKGLLTNLVIAESAQGRRMGELSAQIMRTVQAAQARIPELLRQAMAETIGTEDQAAEKIFSDARTTFPAPPEDDSAQAAPQRELRFGPEDDEERPAARTSSEPPSPPPRSRRRPSADDDDDDFGGRSILS